VHKPAAASLRYGISRPLSILRHRIGQCCRSSRCFSLIEINQWGDEAIRNRLSRPPNLNCRHSLTASSSASERALIRRTLRPSRAIASGARHNGRHQVMGEASAAQESRPPARAAEEGAAGRYRETRKSCITCVTRVDYDQWSPAPSAYEEVKTRGLTWS
jgi:hypothetical protein